MEDCWCRELWEATNMLGSTHFTLQLSRWQLSNCARQAMMRTRTSGDAVEFKIKVMIIPWEDFINNQNSLVHGSLTSCLLWGRRNRWAFSYQLYLMLLAVLDCIYGAKLLQVILKLFSLQIQTSTVLVKRRFGSGDWKQMEHYPVRLVWYPQNWESKRGLIPPGVILI